MIPRSWFRTLGAALRGRIGMVTIAVLVVATVVAGVVAYGSARAEQTAQKDARQALAQQANLTAALLDAQDKKPAAMLPTLRKQRMSAALVAPNGKVTGDWLPRQAVAENQKNRLLNGHLLAFNTTVDEWDAMVEARPLANGGGIVLARTPANTTSPAFEQLLPPLGLGLAVVFLVATLLLRRESSPVTSAAAHARAPVGGDPPEPPSGGPTEVAAVADSLSALADTLQVSATRQRDFLLAVSHELRTPLTAIKGFAESLADGVATGHATQAVGRTIGKEAGRLERLVEDLLELARLGTADFRVDQTQVDLSAVLREAAAVWSTRCAEAGVFFRTEVGESPLFVVTDPGRLRQIVDGLAENALRVTPHGQPIVLALRIESMTSLAPERAAVVEVRDGGPGLTADDRAVAFERSALHERYRGVRNVGTGLGLALVHGLARRLGGTAEVDKAPEGGAAFRIRLPLSHMAQGRQAPPAIEQRWR